jgi:hypothetical protein
MNGMPFEMQLTQPLAETFHAAGVSRRLAGMVRP